MKKVFALLLVLTMCLSLCACGMVSDAFDSAFDQMDDAFNQIMGGESTNQNEGDSNKETTDNNGSTDSTDSDNTKEENTNTETKIDDKTLLESYEGTPLPLFMDKVSQLGYKATYLADGVDFTDFIDAMKEDYITGELTIDTSKKTVIVDLVLASSVDLAGKEAALKEKLELGSSWIAAKEYGIDKYGSSFELNYLVGKIDESLYDENTWFLKAECKVNGQKKTCEARVTGTTANPEVVFFDIY